jgi:malate synthase
MCSLVVAKAFVKKLVAKLNEQKIYQVKNGNQTAWITLDELMKRNKEHHFYLNLLGEQKHESIERHFRPSYGQIENNEILSVSSLRPRSGEKEYRRHGLS